MNDDTRRFSDQEFAVILRTAAELAHSPVTATTEGIRLAEIKQIASEAGISPDVIDRAIRRLDTTGGQKDEGSGSVHFVEWVEGEVSDEDLGRLRDVIREAVGARSRGTVEQVLDSLEWRSDPQKPPVTQVTVTPRDGQTRVEMYTSLAGHRAGVYALAMTPFFLGGLIGAIALSEAGLIPGGLAMLLWLLVSPLPGVGIAHHIWKRLFAKKRQEIAAMFDRVRRATSELAGRSDTSEDPARIAAPSDREPASA